MLAPHPACDLVIAWSFLHGESRRAFRAALPSVDAGAWARARGWALWKALLTLAEPAGAAAAHRYGWRIGALEIVHELVGEHRKGA